MKDKFIRFYRGALAYGMVALIVAVPVVTFLYIASGLNEMSVWEYIGQLIPNLIILAIICLLWLKAVRH